MQFHLNGFKPGNYQIPDSARKPYPNPPIKNLPSEVDVLVVGTGPAGLTLARQLAEFSDIQTCIVDMAQGPLLFGRADGISCRTIEIMEAFNSSEMVVKETYQLKQNTFWEPDVDNPVNITRTEKIADARAGLRRRRLPLHALRRARGRARPRARGARRGRIVGGQADDHDPRRVSVWVHGTCEPPAVAGARWRVCS